MGAAAQGAEVLKTLEPLGIVGLVLLLCRYAYAFWLGWWATRAGRSVEVEVKLQSLKFRIGAKEDNKLYTLPQKGAELDIAVESEVDITEHLVDEDKDDHNDDDEL